MEVDTGMDRNNCAFVVSESGPARAGDSVPPFLDSNVDINGHHHTSTAGTVQFIITASRTFLVRDAVTSILDECGGRYDGRSV
jgi:hypothetical protein